jgi:hypothetical protein
VLAHGQEPGPGHWAPGRGLGSLDHRGGLARLDSPVPLHCRSKSCNDDYKKTWYTVVCPWSCPAGWPCPSPRRCRRPSRARGQRQLAQVIGAALGGRRLESRSRSTGTRAPRGLGLRCLISGGGSPCPSHSDSLSWSYPGAEPPCCWPLATVCPNSAAWPGIGRERMELDGTPRFRLTSRHLTGISARSRHA